MAIVPVRPAYFRKITVALTTATKANQDNKKAIEGSLFRCFL